MYQLTRTSYVLDDLLKVITPPHERPFGKKRIRLSPWTPLHRFAKVVSILTSEGIDRDLPEAPDRIVLSAASTYVDTTFPLAAAALRSNFRTAAVAIESDLSPESPRLEKIGVRRAAIIEMMARTQSVSSRVNPAVRSAMRSSICDVRGCAISAFLSI